jgi:hypothetical protein
MQGLVMRHLTMIAGGLTAAVLAASVFVTEPARAEDAPDPSALTGDPALDALLAKEKEGRKACKIDICSILRSKKAEGADVACTVVQTWPKKSLNEIFSKAQVNWPMGNAFCKTDLKISRAMLAKAMSEAKFEAEFEPHQLQCDVEAGDGKSPPYTFKVTMKPKVTFEGGKATAAKFQWGEVDAPTLAKNVIWPVVQLDNSLGMFSGTFVKMINRFTTAKCDEVKDQLKAE